MGSGSRTGTQSGTGSAGATGGSKSGQSGGGSQQAAGGSTTGGATSGRSSAGRTGGQSGSGAVRDLTPAQLRALLAEVTADDFTKPVPGRININTASIELMKDVLDIDARVAEAIVAKRKSKPEGITSLVDLQGMSGLNPATLAQIATQFDVTSSVYTVTSRGRAASTGAEVEIEAVVDRSQVPARILSYREQ
jgi:DNA uptake protein ComE-like DNA-binding protein